MDQRRKPALRGFLYPYIICRADWSRHSFQAIYLSGCIERYGTVLVTVAVFSPVACISPGWVHQIFRNQCGCLKLSSSYNAKFRRRIGLPPILFFPSKVCTAPSSINSIPPNSWLLHLPYPLISHRIWLSFFVFIYFSVRFTTYLLSFFWSESE